MYVPKSGTEVGYKLETLILNAGTTKSFQSKNKKKKKKKIASRKV